MQFGKSDLTSSAGKLMLTMLAAMERDLLVERTQSGLARAKLRTHLWRRLFATRLGS